MELQQERLPGEKTLVEFVDACSYMQCILDEKRWTVLDNMRDSFIDLISFNVLAKSASVLDVNVIMLVQKCYCY